MQQRLQIIDHFLGPVQLHPIPKHTMLSPAVNVPGFRPFRRRVVRCIVVVVDQTETAKVGKSGQKWAKVGKSGQKWAQFNQSNGYRKEDNGMNNSIDDTQVTTQVINSDHTETQP